MWIITAISFVTAAAAVNFLPDKIPMHFGFDGKTDRMGSKFELFIFPILVLVLALVYFVTKKSIGGQLSTADDEKKSVEAASNLRLTYVVVVCNMALVYLLEFGMILLGLSSDREVSPPAEPPEVTVFVGLICGLVMIVSGNLMPKSRRNAVFGLRTPWSMKDDRSWQLSNRFAGRVMVICGALLIVIPFVLEETAAAAAMVVLITAAVILSIGYSYLAAKKD